MIRIITDTGSDMTEKEAAALNIELIELGVAFGDEHCPTGTEEGRDLFFSMLRSHKELPKTSQPSPADFLEHYEAAKQAGDEVLAVCLSGNLSGTYQSAVMAKDMAEYDSIEVVDTKSVMIGQRMMVERAVSMREAGCSLAEIAAELRSASESIVVMGAVRSLEYLKKGGRIPAALAVVGTMLNIRPALIVRDGRVEMLSKSRGLHLAMERVIKQYESMQRDESWPVMFGYVEDINEGAKFRNMFEHKTKITNCPLYPVGATIGTHVGPGCVVIAYKAEPTEPTEPTEPAVRGQRS